MRIACILLAALASLSSGCSCFIASRGKDVTALKTKEEVRAVFGEPTRSGVEDGLCFEEYRTRRKIVTPMWVGGGEGYVMLLVMTCYTSELGLTPIELYLMGKRTLLGQTIRVTYDATGHATGHYLDGEALWFLGFGRITTNQGVEVAPAPSFPTATPSPVPANPGR